MSSKRQGGDSQKQLAYRGSSEEGVTESKELDVDTNAETWTAMRHHSPAERVYEGPDWVLFLNKGKVTDERKLCTSTRSSRALPGPRY